MPELVVALKFSFFKADIFRLIARFLENLVSDNKHF